MGIFLTIMAFCPFALSQQKPQDTKPSNKAQEQNIQEYIELIRSNVRQEKAQILGAVMQLDAADAAQFWPIYNQYDAELAKLNKLRSDNILDYAATYDSLTDAKADELMKKAIDYQKQRTDLLVKCYDRLRGSVGPVMAARFLQVENQLLLIIDLQIASNLPLMEEQSELAEGDKK
ncbi:MAG: hypothetical protein ROO76_12975 [Terriglobia bacterium]|nr:hypothetical protein [Terriglobia bacterium]